MLFLDQVGVFIGILHCIQMTVNMRIMESSFKASKKTGTAKVNPSSVGSSVAAQSSNASSTAASALSGTQSIDVSSVESSVASKDSSVQSSEALSSSSN